MWENMGSPKNPKDVASMETQSVARCNVEHKKYAIKFKVATLG